MVNDEVSHADRRLHRLLRSDRDFVRDPFDDDFDERPRPNVDITTCDQRDYSIVTVKCKDRPKLVFDTVWALTDMHLNVFHGHVLVTEQEAFQVLS